MRLFADPKDIKSAQPDGDKLGHAAGIDKSATSRVPLDRTMRLSGAKE